RRDAPHLLDRPLKPRAVNAVRGESGLEVGPGLERAWPRLEITGAIGGPGSAGAPRGIALPCEDELLFQPCGAGRSLHAHQCPPLASSQRREPPTSEYSG